MPDMTGFGWQELVIFGISGLPLALWVTGAYWFVNRVEREGWNATGWLFGYLWAGALLGVGSLAVIGAYFLSRPKVDVRD